MSSLIKELSNLEHTLEHSKLQNELYIIITKCSFIKYCSSSTKLFFEVLWFLQHKINLKRPLKNYKFQSLMKLKRIKLEILSSSDSSIWRYLFHNENSKENFPTSRFCELNLPTSWKNVEHNHFEKSRGWKVCGWKALILRWQISSSTSQLHAYLTKVAHINFLTYGKIKKIEKKVRVDFGRQILFLTNVNRH